MKRYSSTPISTRYDGKQVYLSTTYPTINPSDTDIVVITSDGDYLDTLANKYYNDSTLYWIIAKANNLGKGKLSVPSGLSLRIPTNVNQIVSQLNTLNTVIST